MIMRKVDLKMNENRKYEIIKKLVDTNGNKLRVAQKLNLTKRQINRLIVVYKTRGKQGFVHGNTGKTPSNTTSIETKNNILDLYRNKYYDSNYVHFMELLQDIEKIKVSESTVRNILMEENIISPKATKRTKKTFKKLLEEKLDDPKLSIKEREKTAQNLVDIEDAHPRRPRCKYFGEMLQMDASVFEWFAGEETQLHIAVDDSLGTIVGAYIDKQETLNGYYNVLNQTLNEYGIPASFLTDRRTVFEYKKKSDKSIENDTFTQFGYACHQLGIEIKTTSVAQAKGRVERMFQTLQSRLPIEMRLAGVTDIKTANEFLNYHIKKFNAKFSLPVNHSKSVFETQPPKEKINLTLAVLADRKVDAGHCIRFDNKYFKPVNEFNIPVYYRKGTSALVIKALDGNIYTTINDTVYALNEVPKHEAVSRNFDNKKPEPKKKKKWIPPMNHPWRQSSFLKHIRKQSHLDEKSA
jgi:hypothetical protein